MLRDVMLGIIDKDHKNEDVFGIPAGSLLIWLLICQPHDYHS